MSNLAMDDIISVLDGFLDQALIPLQPSGNSWLSSIIATIIGNLKISISNVHIRYEDIVSNPGHPFSSGVTLAKLAAVTTDEHGNEIFDTSGALDKLRKSLQLERLALYHDSDSLPWEIDKRWEDISPQEWIEIFEDGINEPSVDQRLVSKWAMNRTYLVYPINANLQYHRLGNQERTNPEIPFEKVSLVLSDVSLTVTEAQYYDWIKLVEAVSRYKKYLEISHLRPSIPVLKAPKLWWKYAAQAGLQQKKMCYRCSWDQIRHLCQCRRQYVQSYMASLQNPSHVNQLEIREIEKDLDSKVILLWRLLAHAKVESVKSKAAAQQKAVTKRSWFSFGWGADTEEASFEDASEEPQFMEERLTKEEWQAINKLLSYQPDEELALGSSKDMQNMIKLLVTISIGQAAARIISVNQMEIVCGRFEQLNLSTKFKHRSIYCDVLLKFYGLSAPEGSLAQSVSSEQKVNALAASFVHLPIGENIDWRLSATISPCHVTVLMESIDRFLEFVKRSNAVSPTIALETATALQMKFEKVTRRAQEQFQMVLEEQSRFAFDIDLDAPKVRVPLRTSGSLKCGSHFLLDFGHFTLHTVESQSDEQRKNPYSRFLISGRDIAAFFTDSGSEFGSCSSVKLNNDTQPMISSTTEKVENLCFLIDRCGMAVIVDQIRVPHPNYPSTRISVQVPNIGIHFSPERYTKIMDLLNIFYGTIETCSQPTADNFQAKIAPWGPSDLATDGRILVWKGIGNSVAAWQPCFLLLSGSYLYVFDSAKSQSYQRYLRMGGRQVVEVPPTNIGGSPFCIAVCFRGMDIQKALESSSTWILDFRDEEEKAIWFKGLVQATYEASAAPSVDVLGDSEVDTAVSSFVNRTNVRSADLVIKGALMEMKLFIYGKAGNIVDGKLEESLILEILGGGGKVPPQLLGLDGFSTSFCCSSDGVLKNCISVGYAEIRQLFCVHLIHADGDLTVKMKLHYLKIKDELQGRLFMGEHYLAVSVLRNETLTASSGSFDTHGKDVLPEDDDSFTDALSEFMQMDQQGLMGIPPDFESLETLIHENEVEEGQGTSREEYYETEGIDNADFVSVSFATRSSSSPDYDGIDTQMSIRMSKLEFFCNRPTIVALISFGLDISSVNYMTNNADTEATSQEQHLVNKESADKKGRVQGLLGFGKDRVIFYLNMNVDSVTMFLNKEDGSQFATLVQESFLMDLKVHPSSLSIEGTLGNFRLCDRSLGTDHCWAWLCDIRNPGTDSLIKFKFNSYRAEDDDYEGYDYSLQGQLSAVRIVFLYRFVQEVCSETLLVLEIRFDIFLVCMLTLAVALTTPAVAIINTIFCYGARGGT
ncbi:putative vacuolar protein sorting-associated protein [Senna tora]|uniref:Putative vacuolar protein sorting-associated protein n=1 Tax=Senna tora TaxID=362788 RepID=A0A834X432_9FABA|nr:putative vacuolar protein sorting-associated protein [Senna tora]